MNDEEFDAFAQEASAELDSKQTLKKLYKLTGMDVFKMPTIEIDESMSWELVAMCVKHLDAIGVYSMPADPNGDLQVFVAIREIQKLTAK